MHNEFTAIFERDGDWVIAYCPEIPGATGQGRTKPEARESLASAIALMLADRREDGLRAVPPDAERERGPWNDTQPPPASASSSGADALSLGSHRSVASADETRLPQLDDRIP